MNRIFLFIFLLFTQTLLSQTNTTALTLQQCIETAIANNIEVKQTGLQAAAAEVVWKQSKLNLLPSLNSTINHGISQGRSIDPFTNGYVNQKINYANYDLSSSVTLFNGMSLQNGIRQNAYTYQAAKMDWQQVKEELTLNVILAYLQVLNNEDVLALSQAQVSVTQKQLERLEILHKEGAISPPLLYDLTGQLKGEELTVVTNQNALASARLLLTQLMNIPYDKNLHLQRVNVLPLAERYPATATDIYDKAEATLALIKAARWRSKGAAAALKSVRGQLLPSLFLSGGVSTNYSSAARKDVLLGSSYQPTADYVQINGAQVPVYAKQNHMTSEKILYNNQLDNNLSANINLGLRIPLFNGWQTRSRIHLAEMEVKNSELRQEAVRVQLRQEVEQAYLNMENAWNRYKLLVEQVAALSESFRAAEVRFQAGVGTSVDYLVAKNNLDRASTNLIMARYDYLLRTKVLDYYSGSLTKN